MPKKENKNVIHVGTSIPYELRQKAKDYGVSWSEALQTGINIKFREREWGHSIWQHLEIMAVKLGQFSQEKALLEEKIARFGSANETLKSHQKA